MTQKRFGIDTTRIDMTYNHIRITGKRFGVGPKRAYVRQMNDQLPGRVACSGMNLASSLGSK